MSQLNNLMSGSILKKWCKQYYEGPFRNGRGLSQFIYFLVTVYLNISARNRQVVAQPFELNV